jgi:hypothetical protein
MKRFLCLIIVLGVLATSIPIEKFKSMTQNDFMQALGHMQSFFNIIDKCENSEWIDSYPQDGKVVFVIKCMDAKKTGL